MESTQTNDSGLAQKIQSELVKLNDPEEICYAESLIVLKYIHSQYETLDDEADIKLNPHFASINRLEELFKMASGSTKYTWKDEDVEEKEHERCSAIYRQIAPILDKDKRKAGYKRDQVDKAIRGLRRHCRMDDGDMFSLIGPDV